jgi:hypothetical protein
VRVATTEAARLPWVTRLERTRACDGYRWTHMPLKALRDPDVLERYRCRGRARWVFTALKVRHPATDGTYCWSHLLTQLTQYPDEEARLDAALTRMRAGLAALAVRTGRST